jgi:hypothetical protein
MGKCSCCRSQWWYLDKLILCYLVLCTWTSVLLCFIDKYKLVSLSFWCRTWFFLVQNRYWSFSWGSTTCGWNRLNCVSIHQTSQTRRYPKVDPWRGKEKIFNCFIHHQSLLFIFIIDSFSLSLSLFSST